MVDLLKFQDNLKFKIINYKQYIFDPVRKKYVVFTPEELVRQLFVEYLINEKKIPRKYIAVEKQINFGTKPVRFDILIYDKNAIPNLIVECKSFKTKISDIAGFQVGKYNSIIKAKYLCITNGKSTRAFKTDISTNEIIELKEFPDMV